MEVNIEFIIMCSNIIKIITTTILIYFSYIKITNYKVNSVHETIQIVLVSVISAFIYVFLIKLIPPLFSVILVYFIYSLIIKYTVIKQKFNTSAYVISCVLSYSLYLIAIIISGLILLNKRNYTHPISLFTIPIITCILFLFVNKLKRVKNGFGFLNKKTGKGINFCIIFITGVIIFIFGVSQEDISWATGLYLLMGSIFIIISLIIWIKSQITKTYKYNMRDRTIEIQKNEIEEKDKIIEEIKEENLKLAKTIHKYNHKFSALESAMKEFININSKTEFAHELSIILKETEETIENFSKEVCVNKNKLPLTNIHGIDNMFKYMQEEAIKNNINFDLKINESINYLIENIIPKENFEILIGDHLKDSIIAISSANKSYKSILVTLGLVENCYELTIYDSGIEFEIDTLLKLGKEQVTTHKETGGTGIGFMTTFETLKICKASLIIEEYKPETTNYTKAVIIRFDNKNEYKIISYRADAIKKIKKGYNILIKKLI